MKVGIKILMIGLFLISDDLKSEVLSVQTSQMALKPLAEFFISEGMFASLTAQFCLIEQGESLKITGVSSELIIEAFDYHGYKVVVKLGDEPSNQLGIITTDISQQ